MNLLQGFAVLVGVSLLLGFCGIATAQDAPPEPDTPLVDYGVYLNADRTYGVVPLTVDFRVETVGSEPIRSVAWDFNADGITDATGDMSTFTFQDPVDYDVTATVSLSQYRRVVKTITISAHTALMTLTFDDGPMSIHQYGLPLLSSKGIAATAYIVPSWIEVDWYLGWDEVQALYEAGWDIGSHSMTHPRLTDVDDSTLHYELRQSQNELRERGFQADHFAAPYAAYDARVLDAIRLYYKSNRVGGGLSPLPDSADPFVLRSYASLSWRHFHYYAVRIDSVVDRHGWYIMGNHSVCDNCIDETWCISTQMLADVIDYAHERRIKIVTIAEALESVSSELAGCDVWPKDVPEARNGISCVCSSLRLGSEASITYRIQRSGHVDLRVYDVKGRLLRTLFGGEQTAGEYTVVWDGLDASGYHAGPGVYFCRMQSGRESRTAKVIMLK